MIEIIQRKEEDAKDMPEELTPEVREGLPKNFRQIGMPEGTTRIYIEDYVYTYLHPSFSGAAEQRLCILVGNMKQVAEYLCIYIQGAVELQGVTYCGNAPILSEASRAEICLQIKKYFDGSMLLGWFFDAKGIPPKLTPEIERVHKNFFGGNHRILLLSDSLEKDEILYLYEDNAIRKKNGYYIYYERNIAMQEYMIASRKEVHQEVVPEVVKDTALQSYRRMLLERQNRKKPTWNSLVYGTGLLLVISLCVIGISMLNNYQKMKSIEAAVAVMGKSYEKDVSEEADNRLIIESASGGVVPETESTVQPQETPEATVETAALPEEQPATETAVPAELLTEAQQIQLQGYYIVQQGDNMISICKKIYQSTDQVEALCAANGIDNVDQIYAGQKLVLP